MSIKPENAEPGNLAIYNDGRPGHCDVKAEILSADDSRMVVQFEDRADTTTISYADRKWMDYISIIDRQSGQGKSYRGR